MPAEFSSLTAAEQQALMDASMSGPEISEGSAASYEATILGVFAPPQSFEPMRLTEKKLGPPK